MKTGVSFDWNKRVCSLLGVYGRQDDVEIGEEDEEPVLTSDETVTPASDILVREKIGRF